MFEDQAMNEFFGEVKEEPTAKRRRPVENNKENNRFGPQKAKTRQSEELVSTLTRLVIKQEEELQVLKQDHSFMLFMRPGKDTVLTFLFQTASLFKKKQEESPTWGADFQPLRVVLSLALFRELATRLEAVEKDDNKIKEIVDLGWMTHDYKWKVSSMEPRAEAPAGGQDANTPHNRRDQAHAGEVVHGNQDGRCHSIQLHQEAHGDHGDPGHLLLRPVMPQPRTGGMGHDDTTAGQLCPAVIGLAYKRAGLRRGPMAQKLRDLLNVR